MIDQMHVALIEHDVDEAKQFNLFVCFDKLGILIVDVSLELRVEV